MIEALKLCPHCGGKSELIFFEDSEWYIDIGYRPQCPNCGAGWYKSYEKESEAIAAWNRRPEPKPLTMEELSGYPYTYIKRALWLKIGNHKTQAYILTKISRAGDIMDDCDFFTFHGIHREYLSADNYGKKWLAYDREPGKDD